MRVLSLFSGIGGLDLGLERAGMKVVYQSEIDPYACEVLKKHWPDVPNLGDVKKIEWEKLENVQVICGGYPCQPFSTAGKRKGEEDPRHLWPYVFDAIRAIRPHYAIMENVRGHLTLGFGTVLGDLASIGYDAEWQVLPASAFGAPHRRDRVFIVAYPDNSRKRASRGDMVEEWSSTVAGRVDSFDEPRGLCPILAHPDNERSEAVFRENYGLSVVDESSRGFADYWSSEPDVGRVAHGIPARVERLRALGNAVVPQVAEYVGRLVVQHSQIVA